MFTVCTYFQLMYKHCVWIDHTLSKCILGQLKRTSIYVSAYTMLSLGGTMSLKMHDMLIVYFYKALFVSFSQHIPKLV